MVRLAIYFLQALDLALVIWGQQTFPPDIVTFPPPPTMTPVINDSVVLFVGEPIVVGEDVRVTIDCSEVIDPVIAGSIPNPTIRWIKDGVELTGNGSAANVDISEDRRRLIITDTLLAVGGQIGNDGNYTCEVCDDPTDANCRNRTTCIAVCGFPNIVPPTTAPLVNPFIVSLRCGQDVEVASFVSVTILIINCEPFNGSEPFVQEIYKDGVLIQNGTSLALQVIPPSDDNFGTYTFALSTEKCGTTTAVSRILRQADPPDIDEGPFIPRPPTIMPGDMTVTIGTPTYIVDGFDLNVVCDIASGTRPITIMWIRNDMSYPAGGNRSVITIPDTDYEDGDVFFCRADNIVGFDIENTTINVFEPPQVLPIPFPTPPPGGVTVSTGRPANTTIIPGTDVTIYCPSSGTTIPSIEWFKDGVMVMSGGRFTISTTTLPDAVITSVLSIDDFQSADVGTYSCTSTNIVGLDDGRTTLIGDVCVDCPPDAFETPSADPDGCPICGVWETGTFGPCSLACHLGTMIRDVSCVNVADNNRPRVTDSFCDPATEPARIQSCGQGPCATGWRKGPWTKCSTTCQTGHQMRMVVCTSAGVVVSDDQCDQNLRPKSERSCNRHIDCFPTNPPTIAGGQCIPQPEVIPNTDVTVMIGSPAYIIDGFDLTITCNVSTGTPPINISWYRNGVVDPSRRNTSTITISNVDINKNNGVIYTCRAENDEGYDEQLTIVNVFTPLCSHELCNTRKSILCIIPDSMCLCKPQMGYCSAAYYSTETRSLPEGCTRCRIPTDLDCLNTWSQCVKKQDTDAHGRPRRRMRTATNFKIYKHPC